MKRFLSDRYAQAGEIFLRSEINGEAKKPSFFVGVSDFLLTNEDEFVTFGGMARIHLGEVGHARNRFAVKAGIPPTDFAS